MFHATSVQLAHLESHNVLWLLRTVTDLSTRGLFHHCLFITCTIAQNYQSSVFFFFLSSNFPLRIACRLLSNRTVFSYSLIQIILKMSVGFDSKCKSCLGVWFNRQTTSTNSVFVLAVVFSYFALLFSSPGLFLLLLRAALWDCLSADRK